MSEIFSNRVRVKGQALGSTMLWVVNGIISLVFPPLTTWSASLPFVAFAVLMAIQFVVTLLVFPETKGLSLESCSRTLRSPGQLRFSSVQLGWSAYYWRRRRHIELFRKSA